MTVTEQDSATEISFNKAIKSTDMQPEEIIDNSRRLSRNQILTLLSTASLNFSSMICYSILGPFFPQEAMKKGVSETMIGLIFGCYSFFNFLTALILGKYLVQIGAKFMFLAGMFVSGFATILFGLLDKSPDGPIFTTLCFIVRSVDAIGFGASMTASFSILAKAFPNNIATAMGCLEIVTGLGMILGPPVGGILYQEFGYEIPFIALGCVVLLMVPLNVALLPKYDSVPSKDSFWTLFKLPKILLMCFILLSLSSSLGYLQPALSLFVTEKFHLQFGYIGLVYLGLALSYCLSSPLLGIISDRFPGMRKWLLITGNLLSAICLFMLGPAPVFHIESKLWLFILMLVLDGFALGFTALPIFPEMLSSAYENGFEEGLSTLGLISGLFNAMWSLGSFVGPTFGGFLDENLHFEWASAIQAILPLLSAVFCVIFYIWEVNTGNKRCIHPELHTLNSGQIFDFAVKTFNMASSHSKDTLKMNIDLKQNMLAALSSHLVAETSLPASGVLQMGPIYRLSTVQLKKENI
ncbi:MFS-type transporter SLC18B1 [Rhinophrynus dorsalis]